MVTDQGSATFSPKRAVYNMCKGLQATRPSVFSNIGGFGIASRQHEIHKRQFENEFITDEERDSLNAQILPRKPKS